MMRSGRLLQYLLQVIYISNVFTQSFDATSRCSANRHICSWFCGQQRSSANDSSLEPFETDYLSSILYKPFPRKYNSQQAIFDIPGLQPHCMELSLHCPAPNRAATVSQSGREEKRVLQLNFRCEHFVTTYMAEFSRSGDCYEIYPHDMNHLWITNPKCVAKYGRRYRLEGDGQQFLLLSQCMRVVQDFTLDKLAYWLFVNKRNTPEENQRILWQLQLPDAVAIVKKQLQSRDVSKSDPCRCHALEQYFRSIRDCNQVFAPSFAKRYQSRNELTSSTEQPETSFTPRYVEITVEGVLFAIVLLGVSCSVGIMYCAVYLHFRSYMEEPL